MPPAGSIPAEATTRTIPPRRGTWQEIRGKREELQTLNPQPSAHNLAQVSRPAGIFPAGRLRPRPCAIRPLANPRSLTYEPPSCVLTFENVADAFVPTAWMAVRQTTM